MKMKKIFFYCAALAGMLSFSGCSDDFSYDTLDGEGRVLLRPVLNSDVQVKSRAAETNDELAESAVIWISNSKGVVRKYNGFSNVPAAGVNLVSDNYTAEVWAGDSVPASFDVRQFKGMEKFTVSKGSTQQVEIICKIANSVVEVKYADGIENLISNPVITVGHKAGSLTYEGFDAAGKLGYFMMPSFDPDLKVSFTATNIDNGQEVKLDEVIKDAQPTTKYVLNISHKAADPEEFGGALFSITIDKEELTVEEQIEFFAAPTIRGTNFDITKNVTGKRGTITEKKLWIAATSPLKNVVVSCPAFTQYLTIGGNDFDVLNMTDAVKDQLVAHGFTHQLFTHENDAEATDVEKRYQEMKITFSDAFLALFPDGNYTFTISATDENQRTSQVEINIVVSDDKVSVSAENAEQIYYATYATSTTLSATIAVQDATGLGFNYRELGTQTWEKVLYEETKSIRRRASSRAIEVGSTYTVALTGLKSGTTYEYQAICDGFEGPVKTFTTEIASQLPNSGFEEWSSATKPQLIYGDNGEMFWDSGNHGSKLAGIDLTTPDSEIKHSGNYAAKLASQKATVFGIGKFAAGNLFIGKYLKTQGTNGIIGWGRPFTSRPSALKGYVKYIPGLVEFYDNSIPADYGIEKGKNDIGQIFIALVDETTETAEGENWPITINTQSKKLFNKNAANIIAYGELEFKQATDGEGLIEFNIPLTYRKHDIKPSNIVLVCSASKGGDYFTGGNSTMWVDDFELVY